MGRLACDTRESHRVRCNSLEVSAAPIGSHRKLPTGPGSSSTKSVTHSFSDFGVQKSKLKYFNSQIENQKSDVSQIKNSTSNGLFFRQDCYGIQSNLENAVRVENNPLIYVHDEKLYMSYKSSTSHHAMNAPIYSPRLINGEKINALHW